MYQGDYLAAATVYFDFNTASFSDGSPITLAGSPVLSVYKDGGSTESTAGVTLSVDFDSRTGDHSVAIDTSADGTFYAAGHDYSVKITTGTVGGTSVVGRKVGSFSLENRCQKADVRKLLGTAWLAPGVAGTPDVNAKLIGGAVPGSATIGTVTNLTNAPTAGDLTAAMKTSVQTAADAAVTANALVLEIEADTDTLTAGVNVTQVDGASLGTHAAGEFPADVRYYGGNLAAAALQIITPVTGAVPRVALVSVGAGVITNGAFANSAIDATVCPLLGAIDAKTTNLPSDPADASDIAALFTTLTSHGDSAWATITAAGVRTAVGLASANLDTQLTALPTAAQIVTAIKAFAVEANLTFADACKLWSAAAAGLATDMETTTGRLKSADLNAGKTAVVGTKTRITATVDADGNRSAITTDLT